MNFYNNSDFYAGNNELIKQDVSDNTAQLADITTPILSDVGKYWKATGVGEASFQDVGSAVNNYKIESDFLITGTNQYPWLGVAIASGTSLIQPNSNNKHVGVLSMKSSTSNGSGYRYSVDALSINLGGKEKSVHIFSTSSTLSNIIRRMGFLDTLSSNPPIDGVFIKIENGVMTGETFSNSTSSVTTTNFTLSADTWYRAEIELNDNATIATFNLYSDDSDNLLWSSTLNSNIPKGTDRSLGQGDICTMNPSPTAIDIGYIDYMSIEFPNSRRV